MFEVIFDCETQKFFDGSTGYDPSKLGVSIVSVWSGNKMQSFWEKDFSQMFKIFEAADRIIGFNSIGFDVPALSPYLPPHWVKLKHFDILDEIKKVEGKRISLDALAKGTLGVTKSDSGENAVKYWNQGTAEALSKLRKYCEMDVAITRDIYEFVLKNKHLKYVDFWNETREVELDFSYNIEDENQTQASLF